MAISRKTKERLVEEYKEKVADARGLILTGFKGLSVRGAEGLRASVREVGGEFQVVKNSLIQLALQDAGIELPQDALEGTTAVGFATTDIPGVAKAMVDLEKDEQVLQIKAAYVEGRWVQPAQIIRLAELPPLPILQAQLLGLIKTPSRMVASVLASSVRQVVNVVKAYADSGGAEAEAVVEAAVDTEAEVEPEAEAEVETGAEAELETEAEAEVETETETEAEPEAEADPDAEPEA